MTTATLSIPPSLALSANDLTTNNQWQETTAKVLRSTLWHFRGHLILLSTILLTFRLSSEILWVGAGMPILQIKKMILRLTSQITQ